MLGAGRRRLRLASLNDMHAWRLRTILTNHTTRKRSVIYCNENVISLNITAHQNTVSDASWKSRNGNRDRLRSYGSSSLYTRATCPQLGISTRVPRCPPPCSALIIGSTPKRHANAFIPISSAGFRASPDASTHGS